jgi:hypothetical protein
VSTRMIADRPKSSGISEHLWSLDAPPWTLGMPLLSPVVQVVVADLLRRGHGPKPNEVAPTMVVSGSGWRTVGGPQ